MLSMARNSTKFLAFTATLLVCAFQHGQAQILSEEEQQATGGAKTNRERPYSFTFNAATMSSFHRFDEADKAFGSDFSASAVYRIDNYSLIASMSAFQDFRGERRWLWGDGSLSIYRPFSPIWKIQTSGTFSAIVPVSENNRGYRRMHTGFIAAPLFTLPLKDYGLTGLSVSYRPSASYYFHEHEVSLHGSSNTRYSFGQRLRVNYSMTDRLYASLTGSYARSFTYAGNSRDSYGFMSSLGFMASQNVAFEIGHSTQGNPLKPNGFENELVFFNLRDSIAYASISIRI